MGKCFYLRKGDVHTVPSNLPHIGTALNDMTWEEVRAISDAGLAADYFAIGDRKAITLNGTVGSLTFSDETYYAYIIGIDHNAAIEGANRIHFLLGYTDTSGGADIAFIDSKYEGSGSSAAFRMSTANSNAGGWESSYMRETICPAFMAVLPVELQAVLKTVTKYTDNNGEALNTENCVTATDEIIFLLAEFEVMGARSYANSYEQNNQKQYAYYAAGNSRVRCRQSFYGGGVSWWLRSIRGSSWELFAYINSAGAIDSYNAHYSFGVAPAFAV